MNLMDNNTNTNNTPTNESSYQRGFTDGLKAAESKSNEEGFNEGIKTGLTKGYYYGYLDTLKSFLSQDEKFKKIHNKIKLPGNIQESNTDILKNQCKIIVANLEKFKESIQDVNNA